MITVIWYLDDSFLIGYLTPEEYFEFVAELRNVPFETVKEWLTQFDGFFNGEVLGKKKYLRDLSKGNQKKAGIVAALIGQPKTILLDEPFANLDPSSQIRLKELITTIAQKQQTTFLISSHDLTHITEVCDRIVLLESGKVVKDIVKTLTAKDSVSFSYDGPVGSEKFMLEANGLRRVVKLLRLEYMNEVSSIPEFSYSYSLTTSSKDLRDYLKALGKTVAFDSILRRSEGSSELLWRSKNDDEPIEWQPDLSDEERDLTASDISSTTYTTEEVLSAIGATLRKQPITIQGGQNVPLRAEWTPYDGFRVIALVANRE